MTLPITLASISLAAMIDLRTRRIPNYLTFSAMIIGLGINVYYFGLIGLKSSVLGMFVGIGILIIPFALGGMGAGDVKLLAVVGALNGPHFVAFTFLYAAVAGGIIALVIALKKGKVGLVIFNLIWKVNNLATNRSEKKRCRNEVLVTSGLKFPYGIAILLGTLVAYFFEVRF